MSTIIKSLFLFTFLISNFSFGQESDECPHQKDSLTGIYHAIVPEEEPVFGEGENELINYLTLNLEYPENCEQMAGTIYASFFIMKDGSVQHIHILKSFNAQFNTTVIDALSNMPKWKPGMCNSQPVNTRFILPIIIN